MVLSKETTKTLYVKQKMLSGPVINTGFYVRMSHCHNITYAQKVVLHGVDINVIN